MNDNLQGAFESGLGRVGGVSSGLRWSSSVGQTTRTDLAGPTTTTFCSENRFTSRHSDADK